MEWHLEHSISIRGWGAVMKQGKPLPFDVSSAQAFNNAREAFLREFLEDVRCHVELGRAADVGSGVGYLSKFLSDLAFSVVALEGREENVAEARGRFPNITFLTADAENLPLNELGTFDFVLCAGLLYHLENPFKVIRNLHSLTGKLLIVEGMCSPSTHSAMDLLDEGISEDQGLSYVAFYPSESCLVKMLYRSGFPFVYRFQKLPAHELYAATVWRKRERTILAASKVALDLPNLVLAKEPIRSVPGITDPWTTGLRKARAYMGRLTNPLRGRL
jgi:SAM-dependent methyltransferase